MESDESHKNDTNLMRKRPYLAVLLKDLSDGDYQGEYSEADRASNTVDPCHKPGQPTIARIKQ